MRLKQIKLSGFKSFVDPTSFEVPSQLVGIVGPNGCGKSNIIDAVRWVLGESKASELRGESMQDVIFSGSSDRKPASRASVELVFDNSLGRIGGSWGGFAEISVRRILGRDGQSTYLINNQVVRRRDVHDMFLGTGLGPRAYAIIGQGMISRIIEARPEDMRVFLEEAAGVSKYKERRRETEARLADTRENLTRVEDILRELGGQIERLDRQAEVAQRYRELEAERERKQRMLWLVRRDEADSQHAALVEKAAAASVAIEARVAELRGIEAELEQVRARHFEAGNALHDEQGRFYEANAEVARLEAEIRLVSETSTQLRERLSRLQADRAQFASRTDEAAGALGRARAEAQELDAKLEGLEQDFEREAARTPEFDESMTAARVALDEARTAAEESRRALDRTAAEQRAASEGLERIADRRERLRSAENAMREYDPRTLEEARRELAERELQETEQHRELDRRQSDWEDADARRVPTQAELRRVETTLAQTEARIGALRDLQERLESQAKVVPWLERHGLERMRRLWQRVHIDDGWETAVEAVLRERVEAIEVGRLETAMGLAPDAPPAKFSFFAGGDAAVAVPAGAGLVPLAANVRAGEASVDAVVRDWLSGYYVAHDLGDAMARRTSLPAGARFVVPGGHMVGRHALSLYAPDSEQEGVLARQHELENLEKAVRAAKLLAEQARSTAIQVEARASAALEALNAARRVHGEAVRAASSQRLDVQRLEQESERNRIEKERIAGEKAELDAGEAELRASLEEASIRFEEADAALADRQEAVERAREVVAEREDAREVHRRQIREAERTLQDARFARRTLELDAARHEAAIEAARAADLQAQAEATHLDGRLAELDAEPAQQALQAALGARSIREQSLAAARSRQDELASVLRELDEKRLLAERGQEPLRNQLTELRLQEQAARLNADQFRAFLADAQVDEVAELTIRTAFGPTAPKAMWLQGEVTRTGNAIAALGPVNLAALDELAQASERKGFLDSQSADLNDAITTLEDAIRRIDRETRELLQDTYDAVNRHFGILFPQLFGGGEARLILTGDEILDAGIQVMAQPPGKRNSSIHLLSGGEKALTAIALVFSLFQLNPAPFCLLDEVDAPLDDANTERYGDMVRRMSDHTQFLFITHNKITMEVAQQLIGVTMQERGVSRIVAVDLEAAARFAEAA